MLRLGEPLNGGDDDDSRSTGSGLSRAVQAIAAFFSWKKPGGTEGKVEEKREGHRHDPLEAEPLCMFDGREGWHDCCSRNNRHAHSHRRVGATVCGITSDLQAAGPCAAQFHVQCMVKYLTERCAGGLPLECPACGGNLQGIELRGESYFFTSDIDNDHVGMPWLLEQTHMIRHKATQYVAAYQMVRLSLQYGTMTPEEAKTYTETANYTQDKLVNILVTSFAGCQNYDDAFTNFLEIRRVYGTDVAAFIAILDWPIKDVDTEDDVEWLRVLEIMFHEWDIDEYERLQAMLYQYERMWNNACDAVDAVEQ